MRVVSESRGPRLDAHSGCPEPIGRGQPSGRRRGALRRLPRDPDGTRPGHRESPFNTVATRYRSHGWRRRRRKAGGGPSPCPKGTQGPATHHRPKVTNRQGLESQLQSAEPGRQAYLSGWCVVPSSPTVARSSRRLLAHEGGPFVPRGHGPKTLRRGRPLRRRWRDRRSTVAKGSDDGATGSNRCSGAGRNRHALRTLDGPVVRTSGRRARANGWDARRARRLVR